MYIISLNLKFGYSLIEIKYEKNVLNHKKLKKQKRVKSYASLLNFDTLKIKYSFEKASPNMHMNGIFKRNNLSSGRESKESVKSNKQRQRTSDSLRLPFKN